LGASTFRITSHLLKEFVKPVIIASFIATPIAWYLMNEWLKDFAYHIEISWKVFFIVTLSVLVLTLLTMIVQSVKAALANPVESLRNE
jgi:putative ABC transport system permease protein